MDLKYILFGALLCHATVSVFCTANPRANAKTKKLLEVLSGMGDRIISGAFGGYNLFVHEVGFSMEQATEIKKQTGKSPAVYGMDCSPGWETTADGHETDIIDCFNSQIVDYAKKKGIITLSHHFPNPVYAGNRVPGNNINNNDYASILQDGTPARNRWWNMMEKIAKGLQAYKDQGITILYRPFHEVNGDWFWWSALPDQTQNGERQRLFKLLWQDLFNFMKNKGLDNLLWVYSPDQSREYKKDFYPGDKFVDIVGLDWYTEDPNSYVNGYDEMISLGKPFAFAEVGPYGKSQGHFDFELFIKNIVSRYPKAVFFMPWNGITSPLKNKNIWGVYNNPKVVNLEEL
ncbi:mannan endo-1,4-beta-mannosidase-like [Halyomorpha halys]|uniref:mannan endo-1,4-beta-mannosidase-like n=1 Tax=Halyomorpha halys TaxID=286706 RepID=UPI0006D4DA98|nr:uncharacterized protein LOC106689097 [Halyomorpha halys]